MTASDIVHRYRVRTEPGADMLVSGSADLAAQQITIDLPDGTVIACDAVTARAVYMMLSTAVYASLDPIGPFLRVERDIGYGWTSNVATQTTGSSRRPPTAAGPDTDTSAPSRIRGDQP